LALEFCGFFTFLFIGLFWVQVSQVSLCFSFQYCFYLTLVFLASSLFNKSIFFISISLVELILINSNIFPWAFFSWHWFFLILSFNIKLLIIELCHFFNFLSTKLPWECVMKLIQISSGFFIEHCCFFFLLGPSFEILFFLFQSHVVGYSH